MVLRAGVAYNLNIICFDHGAGIAFVRSAIVTTDYLGPDSPLGVADIHIQESAFGPDHSFCTLEARRAAIPTTCPHIHTHRFIHDRGLYASHAHINAVALCLMSMLCAGRGVWPPALLDAAGAVLDRAGASGPKPGAAPQRPRPHAACCKLQAASDSLQEALGRAFLASDLDERSAVHTSYRHHHHRHASASCSTKPSACAVARQAPCAL